MFSEVQLTAGDRLRVMTGYDYGSSAHFITILKVLSLAAACIASGQV